MAKYFTPYEFTKSDIAKKLGINNEPDEEKMNNIIQLMRIMDIFRERWTEYCEENYLGNPAIIITSGYRSEELNKAVGGSKTSAHRFGYACDFEAKNGRNKELFEVVEDTLKSIEFEELIWEKGNRHNPAWIHFALFDSEGRQKREIIRWRG